MASFFPVDFWSHLDPFAAALKGMARPLMDVESSDTKAVVTVDVPGFDLDEIDVTAYDGVISVKAEHTDAECDCDKDKGNADAQCQCPRKRLTERAQRLRRDIVVSDVYDLSKVDAHLDKGVLTITVPKKDDNKGTSHKVEITTGK